MTPTHHLGPAGARVVQTAELLVSRRATRDLLSARALGVMHGPAGSGKTFAAELVVGEFQVGGRGFSSRAARRCCTSPAACIGS
jgi:hypothetical protein